MKTLVAVTLSGLFVTAAFAGGPGHCYDPSARAGYVCAAHACDGNGAVASTNGTCRVCGQKLAAVKSLTHVAIVLYDGVDLFDVAGPRAVFTNAGGFYVYTVSQDGRAVRSGGLEVDPDYSIEKCPWPDVLVVQGNKARAPEWMRRWIDLVGKEADYVLKTDGVSSGIDGALDIVTRVAGAESARRSARAIEYEGWLAQASARK
jgi:transcriptional regulator GlxA family with amidase domain